MFLNLHIFLPNLPMHEQQFPVRKDAPPQSSGNAIASAPIAAPCRKRHTIRWFLLGIAVVFGGVAAASFLSIGTGAPVPLPTLELTEITRRGLDLAAKVIVQSPQGEVHIFSEEEARAGFTAPPDTHVLFTCPADTTPSIEVNVAHGDPGLWNQVRFWGYEYSGSEKANKAAGKTGRALFNGRFWLSQGERNISNACYGHLHTRDADQSEMNMVGGKMYYLMLNGNEDINKNLLLDPSEDADNDCVLDDGEDANENGILDLAEDANNNGIRDALNDISNIGFRVSCLDEDGDHLNSGVETALGTNARDKDSDDDGIADDVEVWGYVVGSERIRTDPADADSDHDGVQDGTELGFFEPGINPPDDTDAEKFIPDADHLTNTDPTDADSDSGGLHDGEEDLNFNGRVDVGETDPNNAADDTAAPIVCPDGLIRGNETCDDGNVTPDDGCSPTCTVEDGWFCDNDPDNDPATDEPSVCEVIIPTFPPTASRHLIFALFGTKFPSQYGGLAGADAFCQLAADSSGLQGSWKAILSDSNENARDRLSITGQIFNTRKIGGQPSNEPVAENANEFWSGTLQHAINYDQNGNPLNAVPYPVLTGSNVDGTRASNSSHDSCEDWTADSGVPVATGRSDSVTSTWIYDAATTVSCGQYTRLYCLQQ